jgi:DNA-binding response OmpR family regulator
VPKPEVPPPEREVDMASPRSARWARTIPGRPNRAPQDPRVRSASDDSQAPVALVVDDEPLVRRFVSSVLRRRGWSVLEADGAEGALAIADVGPVDLLVTDYEMPDVTGAVLARQFRERDEDLPILMVSGHPEAAGEIRGLRGRTAFARKPIAVDDLVSSIGSIVD